MHRSALILALVTAAALPACGKIGGAKSDSPAAGKAATTPTVSTRMYDPMARVAMIRATDFAFDGPDSIPAGWTTFHLANEGATLHHLLLVRLDSAKTAADLAQAMKNPGPPPPWAVFVGGPNAPDPKAQSDATINMSPGQYVMVCLVDSPDHVPHFAKGMVHPFTVIAPGGPPAGEPTADVTVFLTDDAFDVQGTLGAGKHVIRVINNGPQLHELELVRLAPGKTAKDLTNWVLTYKGPPPASGIGGISPEVTGLTEYFTVDLTPGNYALVCFVPDLKDGKLHTLHGMVKEIKIT